MIILRDKNFSGRSEKDLEKLSDYELTKIVKRAENRSKATKKLSNGLGMIGAITAPAVGQANLKGVATGYIAGSAVGLGIGMAQGKKKKEEAQKALAILRKRNTGKK